MKVSAEEREANHTRIIATAATALREHGINGIGVDGIMERAGFTAGGFYNHFRSKDALVGEALKYSFEATSDNLNAVAQKTRGDRLDALISEYLSAETRDHPGSSCVASAVGCEVRNRSSEVRKIFSGGIENFVEMIVSYIPDGTRSEKRARAVAAVSALTGALMVARGVHEKKLSDEILRSTRSILLKILNGSD
jgi:TetR/AcrR family transcriptional repressor of nem operon